MFDIGYGELLLIAIVALLVLGPDKLPGALRTAGLWIAKFRRSFDKVRAEIEQEVGADDIRRQIHNEMMLDQAREIRREIEAAAKEMKDGVQPPIADLPGSRSAALARAGAATPDQVPNPASGDAAPEPGGTGNAAAADQPAPAVPPAAGASPTP